MSGTLSAEVAAGSAAAMIDHLTPPLAAGARRSRFGPDAAGLVSLPEAKRPTILLRLRRDLSERELSVTLSAPGAQDRQLAFASWSEMGSCLIVSGAAEQAESHDIGIKATLGVDPLSAEELAAWLEIDQLQGNFGRFLAVLGDEKVRLRRELRQIAANRAISTAIDDALDRLGAELGIPRLTSAPKWDAAAAEIISIARRELDEEYRARLSVWRPLVVPTPEAFGKILASVEPRVTIEEASGGLSSAVLLVELPNPGSPSVRTYVLERIKRDRLIPLAPAAGEPRRPLSDPAAKRELELRQRLSEAFDADPGFAVAPVLANALDRAGRVVKALGGSTLPIKQAQDDAGGSRHELGLGVTLRLPTTPETDAVRAALAAPDRVRSPDAEAEMMIASLSASPPAEADRTMEWLWRGLGFSTVHRLNRDNIYLSHLRIGGLTLFELGRSGDDVLVGAALNAPGDPERTAALETALERAAQSAPAQFDIVATPDIADRLTAAEAFEPTAQMESAFVGAGLPATGRQFPTAVRAVAPELWSLLRLPDGLDDHIRTGDPQAIVALHDLSAALERAGVVSLMPLMTPSDSFLAVGSVALPGAGLNAGERAASTIRWSIIPIVGKASLTSSTGFETRVRFEEPGLVALVASAYTRGEGPDPYELRIAAGEGDLLDLAAYEKVMNALERACPIGVEINTWRLRRRHVDVNGDGLADPLPPTLARHYRRFRIPRLRGLEEPADDADPNSLQLL